MQTAHLDGWSSIGNTAVDFYLGRDPISVFKNNSRPPLQIFSLQNVELP